VLFGLWEARDTSAMLFPLHTGHSLAPVCPALLKEIDVLRLTLRFSCFVGVLLMASFVLAQTEFSGDVVDTHTEKAGKGPTKVYFGKDKIRFESAEMGDPRGGGAVILDLKADSWMVLMPKQHMYMQMPEKMMESRGMFHFFKTGDVDNACSEWLSQEQNKGGTCHKVGSEIVNGRNTVKYEGTNSNGDHSTVWLDSKLRFPVKWQEKNGGGEMRNIQEGSQPASLFDIPAGYTKFDMPQGMMQRPQ